MIERTSNHLVGALAGLQRSELPEATTDFWDAHDLAAAYEAEDVVQLWNSGIIGADGLTKGVVMERNGGVGPYFASGGLGGGPSLRLVRDSYMRAGARSYGGGERMNIFLLLHHPEDFIIFSGNRGSLRDVSLSVHGGLIRQHTSSAWGGSTQFERPFPHKEKPYLLRIENDGATWRFWQNKDLVAEGKGLDPNAINFQLEGYHSGAVDVGFALIANGDVTEAEWDALMAWAGERWDVPGLPSGDDTAAGEAGSLWWWLLGGALVLGGGYAVSQQSNDEGDDTSSSANNSQTNNTPKAT